MSRPIIEGRDRLAIRIDQADFRHGTSIDTRVL